MLTQDSKKACHKVFGLELFSLEPKSSLLKLELKEELTKTNGLFFLPLVNHNRKRSRREKMGLTWRDTLERVFLSKIGVLEGWESRGYIYNFFLYSCLLNGFPNVKSVLKS